MPKSPPPARAPSSPTRRKGANKGASVHFTHFDEAGQAHMVDVGGKEVTHRVARAVGRIAMLHRVGPVAVTESAVVIVVSAPHRDEAFAAARFCIDTLKATVPIWKREQWRDGESWGLEPQHITDVPATDDASSQRSVR